MLTLDPSSIPASTAWPDMPDYSFSEITVTWDPPDCEGTLEIVELEATDGYLPADDGTLTPMGDNCWRYDAFDEPLGEVCSKPVRVWIAAVAGDVELDRKSILVLPVHTFLTTGPGADFQTDYEYLRWKYAAVLATTGGGFYSETISTDACVGCPFGCVYACTTLGLDERYRVEFGTSTFTSTENQAASIIGHELTHTLDASECEAYQWEVDHSQQTGTWFCDTPYLATVLQYLADPENDCP